MAPNHIRAHECPAPLLGEQRKSVPCSAMPFLTLYPTGQPRPNASVLNAFEGQTVTNTSIIPAGTNSAIDVYAFERTRVVVDVSGYFSR